MFKEDLSPFFTETDFGEKAVITLKSGEQIFLNVIFDSPTENAVIAETSIEADDFFVTCKTSEIVKVRRKDSIVVKNKTYTIERIRDDGTGVSILSLK